MPGEPVNSFRPSGNVTFVLFTVRDPSLARYPMTTTCVPGATVFLLKPRRISELGEPISMFQVTCLAVGLLDTQIQPAMRVDEVHPTHLALERDRLLHVVFSGKGVVRVRRRHASEPDTGR